MGSVASNCRGSWVPNYPPFCTCKSRAGGPRSGSGTPCFAKALPSLGLRTPRCQPCARCPSTVGGRMLTFGNSPGRPRPIRDHYALVLLHLRHVAGQQHAMPGGNTRGPKGRSESSSASHPFRARNGRHWLTASAQSRQAPSMSRAAAHMGSAVGQVSTIGRPRSNGVELSGPRGRPGLTSRHSGRNRPKARA